MPTASPPMALLALNGYSGTQIATAAGKSLTNVSHILTGRLNWNDDIEAVMLEVTDDPKLVAEIKTMAANRRAAFVAEKEVEKAAALEARQAYRDAQEAR